jgi:hypothetical protein
MLTLNSTNRVTFNVNVHGTSATPTVRCVIGDVPGMTYPATKLSDDKYEVVIDLPKTVNEGSLPFKVEVLLNGRLFTPISTQISVQRDEKPAEVTVEPAPAVVDAPAPAPTVAPAPSILKQTAKVAEAVPVTVPAKKTTKVKPGLSALEAVVKKPVEKLKPRNTPEPAKANTKPAKISIASIANEAAERDTHTHTAEPHVVVEQITSIPISLVKGDIIYR